jgi:hypothetical protein
MSGTVSTIARDPPLVANKRPGAVRLLKPNYPNNAAFLLVSIVSMLYSNKMLRMLLE